MIESMIASIALIVITSLSVVSAEKYCDLRYA